MNNYHHMKLLKENIDLIDNDSMTEDSPEDWDFKSKDRKAADIERIKSRYIRTASDVSYSGMLDAIRAAYDAGYAFGEEKYKK